MHQKVLQTSTRANREEMKEYLKNEEKRKLESEIEQNRGYGEQTRAPVQQQQIMTRAQCARCQSLLLIPQHADKFQCPRCRMVNQRRVVQMQRVPQQHVQQNYYPQQRI